MSYQARWKPHRGYIRLTVGGPMSLLHTQASKKFWNAVCQNQSAGEEKFYFHPSSTRFSHTFLLEESYLKKTSFKKLTHRHENTTRTRTSTRIRTHANALATREIVI